MYNIRVDGASIRVALDGRFLFSEFGRFRPSLEMNCLARSKEPAIVDKITNDLPRPISSAMIPPLASARDGRFAPVRI